MENLENLLRPKPIGAKINFDGAACTFLFKPRAAERLFNHIQEDIGAFSAIAPRSILSLRESLGKALTRDNVAPLWKNEQNCFAWQRNAEWIQLRLRAEDFQDFVESAIAMPNYTADPGPPSLEAARRWPCLSDIALLVQMMPAMHKRQRLRAGRNTSLEIVDLFVE